MIGSTSYGAHGGARLVCAFTAALTFGLGYGQLVATGEDQNLTQGATASRPGSSR